MIDAHVHLERGPYTIEWIYEFVKTARSRGIDEIWLLEHCYRFTEFVPMYDSIRADSPYLDQWFQRKAGVRQLQEYLDLIRRAKEERLPVKVCFGLEICYFKEHEKLVRGITQGAGLDFLVGSVHFIDGFAFDHKVELWNGIDVDQCYRKYFESSISLAESRLFDGIAHPDRIKLFGHRPSFALQPYYERLATALARSGMYAEQNSGSHRRTGVEVEMDRELIAALKRCGVPIVTASDAHTPEDVGLRIGQEK